MTEPRHQRIATYMRGLLAERRIPKSDAARHLDMPPQTFSRKINGKTPFTVDEVDSLLDLFGLTWADVARQTD